MMIGLPRFTSWCGVAALLALTVAVPSVFADETERGRNDAAVASEPPRHISQRQVREGQLMAPRAFRAAADRIGPSVVTIETFGGVVRHPDGEPRHPTRGQPTGGISRPGEGPTTGLIVSEDGHIITSAYNFLTEPSLITVILDDGSQHVAELLGQDETRQLAMIRITDADDLELSVPEFAERDELRVGQWAISIGVGYGGEQVALSSGVISALHRMGGRAVQTDANISPANYGGPLLDIRGRVIGICVPLSPGGGGAMAGVQWYDSGIGFAVPLHDSPTLLDDLKAGKTIRPGRLGIQVRADEAGVWVVEPIEGSPADEAGIESGDRMVKVAGQDIPGLMQLQAVMRGLDAGQEIDVIVERDGEKVEMTITLVAGFERVAPEPPGVDRFRPQDDDEEQEGEPAEQQRPDGPEADEPLPEGEDIPAEEPAERMPQMPGS